MTLVAVILTKNEDIHLERCLRNVRDITSKIIVVDSFSVDRTEEIATSFNATFIQNTFENHSQQFNFALTQISQDTEWVLRIDADEYLTPRLVASIKAATMIDSRFMGFSLKRRIKFAGKLIEYGGLFPVEIVRLFRFGHGVCEERWMDEHIIVDGPVGKLAGELIDDNLNNLTWWIQKHNLYSNREAVEMLKLKYSPRPPKLSLTGPASFKRSIKEKVYFRLPAIPKVLVYFLYRFVIRLGFLDAREGFAFHFLQGFWYRYLVEAKVQEVEKYMRERNAALHDAIKQVLEIKI